MLVLYVGYEIVVTVSVVNLAGAPVDIRGGTVRAEGRARADASADWVASAAIVDDASGKLTLTMTPTLAGSGTYEIWISGVEGISEGQPVKTGTYRVSRPIVVPA